MKYIIGVIIGVIIAYLVGWGVYCVLWFVICRCFSWDFVLGHATGTYIISCVALAFLKQIFGSKKP